MTPAQVEAADAADSAVVRGLRAPEPALAAEAIRRPHRDGTGVILTQSSWLRAGAARIAGRFRARGPGTGFAHSPASGSPTPGGGMLMSRWTVVLALVAFGCAACGGDAPQTPAGPSAAVAANPGPSSVTQGARILGNVSAGVPLAAMAAQVVGTPISATVGAGGGFSLEGVPAGRCSVAIRRLGRRRVGCAEPGETGRRRQPARRRGRGDGDGPERVEERRREGGTRGARRVAAADPAGSHPARRRQDRDDQRGDGHPRRQRQRQGIRRPGHRPARARQGHTGRRWHRGGQHPHPEHHHDHPGERQWDRRESVGHGRGLHVPDRRAARSTAMPTTVFFGDERRSARRSPRS